VDFLPAFRRDIICATFFRGAQLGTQGTHQTSEGVLLRVDRVSLGTSHDLVDSLFSLIPVRMAIDSRQMPASCFHIPLASVFTMSQSQIDLPEEFSGLDYRLREDQRPREVDVDNPLDYRMIDASIANRDHFWRCHQNRTSNRAI
jgi:hypothetical protein